MSIYKLEFCVVALGVVLLLLEAFAPKRFKSKSCIALIGAAGLTVILGFLIAGSYCAACREVPTWLSRFYSTEGHAIFFKGFALVSTILVLLMSYDFRSILNKYTSNNNSDENTGEFYVLPLFACAGLMWMASATDLVSIFVSLELVTITFYIMVAFMRRNVGSLEAGVKYLILGALSTGFLVYGIAWLYGATGTTHIPTMNLGLQLDASTIQAVKEGAQAPEGSILKMMHDVFGEVNLNSIQVTQLNSITSSPTLLFGLSLIILSLAFKVGAAPMQLWIPDVYQGAPTPITSFLSVASKAAGFGVAITILKPFIEAEATGATVKTILVILAAATLLYGNLSALAQTNFKRLLAYSSIAHAGFMLLGMAAGAFEFVMFYLATYLVMTFAAFFILGIVRVQDDSDEISTFDGLNKRNPQLALALTIIMAGMAGVPLTAGFIGKFLMFSAALDSSISMIVIVIAFISAAAGFYYYFKVIRAIYWHSSENTTPLTIPCISKVAIIILTAATIILGIYPKVLEPLIGISL